MKELSCGIVIETSHGLLAMLPSGRKRGIEHNYDIPKGHIEEGETPIQCALRELREESGIILSDTDVNNLVDMGQRKYLKHKDLHVFYLRTELPEDFGFHCDTNFVMDDGSERPEMVGYKWVDSTKYYFKNMEAVLNQLPQLQKYIH